MADDHLFKPIQRRRIYEDVIHQIKSLILNRQLKPGDKLPSERELGELFSIGRPAVREALRTLDVLQLIQIEQGKGAFVREFNYDSYIESLSESIGVTLFSESISLSELWGARKLIEPSIASIAAENAKKEDHFELNRIVEESRKIVHYGGDFPKYAAIFHREVANITKNKVLSFVMESLLTLRLKSRHKIMIGKDYRKETHEYHLEISEAIKKESPEEAYRLMREHLEQVEAYYTKHLKELNGG